VLLDEIGLAGEPRLTGLAERALAEADEGHARRLVERLGLALQASLLLRHAPEAVAGAFLASRLGEGGLAYGTLPKGPDLASIIDRHKSIQGTGA
jgi:putative acyl-CoA dehydrogenase